MKKPALHWTTLTLALSLGLGASATLAAAASIHPPSQNSTIASDTLLARLRFKVRGVGRSRNREGGISRGEGCRTESDRQLTAVVPTDAVGSTLSPYPTLFVYVPEIEARAAELILFNEAEDRQLYQAKFALPEVAGVVHFKIPANGDSPPLEAGEKYRWYISVICNPNDRSEDLMVDGWIRRIQPDTALATQLETAPLPERPALLAEAGIWNDTLASLAQLLAQNPNDPSLKSDWASVLEAGELDPLANEPLVFPAARESAAVGSE